MSTHTINPNDPVLTKASVAAFGDTVHFAAGQHSSSPITLKPGVKYTGVPGKSFWKFNTGGPFAINAPPNLFIDGIMLENNGGLILASKLDGANATRCGLKFDGSGNSAVGIRSTGGTINTKIEQNYFHDSKKSYRDCDLWGVNGLSYSRNHFRDTCYGAHIIIADGINNIVGNIGTGYDQMSLEVQDFGIVHGRGEVNYTDNVMYGWRTGSTGGQNNAFGYSFGTQFCAALRCKSNYTALGDWNAAGEYFENPRFGGTHWGYGGEHGGMNICLVENGTFVGKWVQGLVIMTANGQMTGVRVYGTQEWGPWGTESGNAEHGKWTSILNSTGNLPLSQAPKPPRRVTGMPWDTSPSPGPNPDPTPDPTPMPATIKSISNAKPKAGESVTIVIDGGTSIEIDLEGDNQPALATGAGSKSYTVAIPASATTAMALKVKADGVEIGRWPIVTGTTPPPDTTLNYDVINSHRNGKYVSTKVVQVP